MKDKKRNTKPMLILNDDLEVVGTIKKNDVRKELNLKHSQFQTWLINNNGTFRGKYFVIEDM